MTHIEHFIHSLGINSTYRGYRYLAFAISLALYDEDYLLFIGKYLYSAIASQYDTTTGSVERNIRTVIKICWEKGNRELLEEVTPYPLESRPSTGEFLDIVVNHLKRNNQIFLKKAQ